MRRFLEKLKKSWGRQLPILLVAASCMALATFAVLLAVDQNRSALRPSATDPEDAGSPDGGAAAEQFKLQVIGDIPEEIPDGIATIMQRSAIVYWMKGNEIRYGNGYVLRDGIVVTAAHIVEPGEAPVTVYCDSGKQPGKVVAYDRVRDVAVVEAECAAPAMARFSRRRPGLYDQLMTTGYSFVRTGPSAVVAHRYLSFTTAVPAARLEKVPEVRTNAETWKVLLKMRERKLPRLRALSGSAQPGQSGSFVVNEDGAVVGMIILTVPFHQRTFYVPSVSIRNMLLQEWILP